MAKFRSNRRRVCASATHAGCRSNLAVDGVKLLTRTSGPVELSRTVAPSKPIQSYFPSVLTCRWLVVISFSTFAVFRYFVTQVNRLSYKITLHVTVLQQHFPVSHIPKTKNSNEENRWSRCSGLMSSSNPTPTSTSAILAWPVLVGVDVCGYLLSHVFISEWRETHWWVSDTPVDWLTSSESGGWESWYLRSVGLTGCFLGNGIKRPPDLSLPFLPNTVKNIPVFDDSPSDCSASTRQRCTADYVLNFHRICPKMWLWKCRYVSVAM